MSEQKKKMKKSDYVRERCRREKPRLVWKRVNKEKEEEPAPYVPLTFMMSSSSGRGDGSDESS
jgi:hypothetical protein